MRFRFIEPASLFNYTIGMLVGFYVITEISSIIWAIITLVIIGILERLYIKFASQDNGE